MFHGVERFKAPKNAGRKSKRQDWRKELQFESQKKTMQCIGYALNILGFLTGMGAILFGYSAPICVYGCLAIPLITAIVYFSFQQYYTLMGSKGYKQSGYTAKVTSIASGIAIPIAALTLFNIRNYHYPDWTQIIFGTIVVLIPVGAFFCWKSREARENPTFLLEIILVGVVFIHGYICQVNHMLNRRQNDVQTCIVTDLRKADGSKSGDRYYLTARLTDNSELELPIDGYAYDHIESGDSVEIFYGTGALGIEYAYLSGYQEQCQ